MSISPRRSPYLWVTWITGLLSGDRHCEWAAWLKAHYSFDKQPEDPARENNLAQWKAEHAEMVKTHAVALVEDGYVVRLEDQNKFSYRGVAATLGGCPDVVALKPGVVRVDDVKSGKTRDSDYWQVGIYGFLLPLVSKAYSEQVVEGNVVYRDRVRPVSPAEIVAMRPLIVERIKRTSGAAEPARTPSQSECGFCDIAGCPDRIKTVPSEMEAEGDAF